MMKPGVRWQRAAAFAGDPDVEREYRRLRRRGKLRLQRKIEYEERPWPYGTVPLLSSFLEFNLLRDAIVRRAAEDGYALRRTWTDRWGREDRLGKWLLLELDRPLTRKDFDPRPAVLRDAADDYERLKAAAADERPFFTSGYAMNTPCVHALVGEHPTSLLFRELDRLAAADGYRIERYQCDDVGDELVLVPLG